MSQEAITNRTRFIGRFAAVTLLAVASFVAAFEASTLSAGTAHAALAVR